MDQHTALSWRLHLIQRALEANQLRVPGLAYLATEDEWKSIIKDVQGLAFYPPLQLESLDTADKIVYMGITVIKPKTL